MKRAERTPVDLVTPGKIAELHQCAGACLFKYQQIEGLLKMLLPHMRPAGGEPPVGVDWRRLIDSKATLGILFREFATKCTTDVPDVLGGYLEQLAAQRNDLVHVRFTDPARRLVTDEHIDRAIAELNAELHFAQPLAAVLCEIALAMKEYLERQGSVPDAPTIPD